VNPYSAFETLDDMIRGGMLPGLTHEKAVKSYIKALNKGVLKVMSKMGISTLQSYRGAQIFEAVGLEKDFVERYFHAHRLAHRRRRHRRDCRGGGRAAHPRVPGTSVADRDLDEGGEYQWRRDGEFHLFKPGHCIQAAARDAKRQFKVYKEYTQASTNRRASARRCAVSSS
jgi:glutamate synthase (ferredoxin)